MLADRSADALDKSQARLTLYLLSPGVRRTLAALRSGGKLTGAEREVLRRTVEVIGRNAALRYFQQQGQVLHSHPARLRSLIEGLLQGSRGLTSAGAAIAPAGNPFSARDAVLADPAKGAGGRSLIDAVRVVLGSPHAIGYLRSLPSIGLAPFVSMSRQTHAASVSGSGADCTIAQARAAIAASSALGWEITASSLQDLLLGSPLESVLSRLTAHNPGLASRSAMFIRGFGRLGSIGLTITVAYESLRSGMQLGSFLVGVAWNAYVHCVAARIELLPGKAMRAAGEWVSFELEAFAGGEEIGPVRPDTMSVGDGECESGAQQWKCFGKTVGPHPLVARFGGLADSGTLTVTPGPLHSLDLTPKESDAGAESGVGEHTTRFGVTGKDLFGNELPVQVGPLSGEAHLSISPEGKCEDTYTYCLAYEPGPHTVTVHFQSFSDVAEVEVHPNKLNLLPAAVKLPAGQPQKFTAGEWSWGGTLLRTGVPFGVGPEQAHLTIYPPYAGTCDDATASCTGSSYGAHIVTAATEREHAVGHALFEVEGQAKCTETGGGQEESSALQRRVEAQATGAVTGPGWSQPVQVSASLEHGGFPSVALNRAGTAAIVWIAYGNVVRAVTQTLAEPAWSSVSAAGWDGNAMGAPEVAIDPQGDWTAVWTHYDEPFADDFTGIRAVQCNGQNLSSVQTLAVPNHGAGNFDPRASVSPVVVMGGDRTATAMWSIESAEAIDAENPGERRGVAGIATSTAHVGGPWSAPTTLTEPENWTGGISSLAADGTGRVYAIWGGSRAPYCSEIQSAVKPSGGAWSGVLTVARASAACDQDHFFYTIGEPDLTVSEGGRAIASWAGNTETQPWSVVAGDMASNGTVSSPVDVSASTPGDAVAAPAVAVDDRADAVAVWVNGATVRAAIRRGGGGWQEPTTLASEGAQPAVGMDAAGDALAMWREGSRIETAYMPAGGSWGAAATLTTSADISDGRPRLAMNGSGHAVASWVDGTGNIWAANFSP